MKISEIDALDERLVRIVPSPRQVAYQKMEFTGFIHFTVNTFTDREWGDGTENENIFNPLNLSARQWVTSMKAAGMRGIILTCKHHDGFCLWPSKYTEHTIAKSPYKNGKGDIVKELSIACADEGMKFGIYLSPWDRNNELYGQGKAYDNFFINQLTELLTGYGEIYTVWLDGACGEGPNGKKQLYDFPRYYETIRKYSPNACINICGPDIRWCGNEAGDTRESEWSVVPYRTCQTEYTASISQTKEQDTSGLRTIKASDRDLGSREILQNEGNLIWYPAEVNTSIRPGWFYHADEDDKVKALSELIDIYENSVGGNATFLLNVPVNKEGLFSPKDVERLKELGHYIKANFSEKNNVALDAVIKKIDVPCQKDCDIENILSDDDKYYMAPQGKRKISFSIQFKGKKRLKYIVLQENISKSQRIEQFIIYCKKDKEFEELYKGTTVGYKKIIRLEDIKTDEIKIEINDSRVCPTLRFVGVYAER